MLPYSDQHHELLITGKWFCSHTVPAKLFLYHIHQCTCHLTLIVLNHFCHFSPEWSQGTWALIDQCLGVCQTVAWHPVQRKGMDSTVLYTLELVINSIIARAHRHSKKTYPWNTLNFWSCYLWTSECNIALSGFYALSISSISTLHSWSSVCNPSSYH